MAHRVISTRVVTDCPADGGARRRRWVGRESEAAIGGCAGGSSQVCEDDARVDVGGRRLGVDVVDARHVAREVEDDAVADSVARHRCSAATCGEGRLEVMAAGCDLSHLGGVAGEGNCHWPNPVIGCVVGVFGTSTRRSIDLDAELGEFGDDRRCGRRGGG
ncbi:Uncharacterised protein [Mycobacteroides abscessus subsp. abscessus]|nr:Uncharacterised protein [Mycobacteroides abscessus subsp. abscessus]